MARERKETKDINVAIVGARFMGRAHSHALANVAQLFRPAAASGDACRLRA